MSTLATFGVSKDHARERAGLLSGGPAVGRLSGLGLARIPEGGTRKNCVAMSWRIEGATVVESYPGMVVIEGNGTAVITAGPSDVVVRDGAGLTIARIPGCSERAFALAFPIQNPATAITIEALEGGEGMVFSGYRPVPAITAIEIEPVAVPGTLVIDGTVYFIQGIHANVVARVRDPLSEGWSHAGRTLFFEYPKNSGGYVYLTGAIYNSNWFFSYYYQPWKQSIYTNQQIGAWQTVEVEIDQDRNYLPGVTPPSYETNKVIIGADSGVVAAVSPEIHIIPNQIRFSRVSCRFNFQYTNDAWTGWFSGSFPGYGCVQVRLSRAFDVSPDFYVNLIDSEWNLEYENQWSQNKVQFTDRHYQFVCAMNNWNARGYKSAKIEITREEYAIRKNGGGLLYGPLTPQTFVTEYTIDRITDYRSTWDHYTWRVADSWVFGRRFPL